MIDEKINNSLRELEQGLKSLESAREQVKKTVNSYDSLKSTTAEYVSILDTITTKIQELINAIGNDYSQKVEAFEKDRDAVITASSSATEKLSNATEDFKNSLFEIQTRQKYSLIVNAVLLVAVAAVLFLLMK